MSGCAVTIAYTMKTLPALFATSLLLCAFGCSKKDKSANESPPPAVSADDTDEVPPTDLSAGLTLALVSSATDLPETGADWNESLAKMEAQLGKVTTIHGADYRWAARSGESCAYLSLEMRAAETGAVVGAVQAPVTVSADTEADWNRCLDSVGAQGALAEDKSAPEPPASGGETTIANLFQGVAGKSSKWVGAQVSIKGFYIGTHATYVEDVKTTTISISADKGESKDSIGCTFAAGEVVPQFKDGDQLKVSGVVHGNFGGGLQACKLVP